MPIDLKKLTDEHKGRQVIYKPKVLGQGSVAELTGWTKGGHVEFAHIKMWGDERSTTVLPCHLTMLGEE